MASESIIQKIKDVTDWGDYDIAAALGLSRVHVNRIRMGHEPERLKPAQLETVAMILRDTAKDYLDLAAYLDLMA